MNTFALGKSVLVYMDVFIKLLGGRINFLNGYLYFNRKPFLYQRMVYFFYDEIIPYCNLYSEK